MSSLFHRFSWCNARSICFTALLCLFASTLHASVLDWPNGGWTAGTPSPGQTFAQSFTVDTPNDVTVSINNNGASGTGATWLAPYPQIDSTHTTGGFTGVNGLQLVVTSEATTSSFIKVVVSFASPVTNLSFQLWDIDANAGQFADTIQNIQGLTDTSTIVGATSISSAVAGYNTITGSGLSTVVTGTASAANNTNQGTIDVSFVGPITQFSFEWSNTDPGLGQQAIGLGPLAFTVVPEMSAGYFVALVCALALISSEISRRVRSTTR